MAESKVVAVAGATGGLGKHIVRALLEHGLAVVALVRRDVPDYLNSLCLSKRPAKLTLERVTYPDPASTPQEHRACVLSMTSAFAKHSVDTVISVLDGYGPVLYAAESALLDAALACAPSVKRFAPSTFTAPLENLGSIRACQPKLRFFERLQNEDAVTITWTEFATGLFMNYLGFSSTAPPDQVTGLGAMGHLIPIPFLLEPGPASAADASPASVMTTSSAEAPRSWNPLLRHDVTLAASSPAPLHLLIPGTGDEPVVLTSIDDIALSVARSCLSPLPWTPRSGWSVGCQTTYNSILGSLSALKDVRVTRMPLQELEERVEKAKEEGKDETEAFFDELYVVIAKGRFAFEVPEEAVAKDPGMSAEAFVKRWWSSA